MLLREPQFSTVEGTLLPSGKAWISGTMASSGRLLGLQLPPPPSHLSVRSPHTDTNDAKDCCSLEPPFTPLARSHSDITSLGEFQAPDPTASPLDAQPDKPTETKEKTTTEDGDVNEGQSSTHSSPGFGLRSKLTSMLSLEKRVSLHSHNVMMEMAGFTRMAPIADSKLCAAIQKESFARMFDLYDDARCYGAPGAYSSVGRACGEQGDLGVRADLAWMDDKGNDAWGTEPWHSDQRSILMKTLHIMRCDIESLKMMLRSLNLPAARGGPLDPHLHETVGYMPYTQPVMMRSNSAMAELKQPSDEHAVDSVKEDKELAQAVEKERESLELVDKDLVDKELLDVPPPEKEESEESISTWSHGCPKKRRQWWRELLAAFGLTVWVITGAVLVAKAIGVPNLGVSNNVAYNGFWGRSDDEETHTPVQGAMGVVELSSYTFNDTIKKRPTFVMFYAPWCPHCQRLHPVWTQLAGVLNKKGYNVQLAIVDATKHSRLADKYEVPGFPTLIMFKDGKPAGRHRGARDIDTLMSFIDSNNSRTTEATGSSSNDSSSNWSQLQQNYSTPNALSPGSLYDQE